MFVEFVMKILEPYARSFKSRASKNVKKKNIYLCRAYNHEAVREVWKQLRISYIMVYKMSSIYNKMCKYGNIVQRFIVVM